MSQILGALLLAGILPLGGEAEAERFPIEASGEIGFHLDGARFIARGAPKAELYLSIPESDLTASPDSAGYSLVAIEIRFDTESGDAIATARASYWLPRQESPAGDVTLPPRHLLTLSPELPPGTGGVTVRVEDPAGRKRGLVSRLRGKKPSGEARARFSDPAPSRPFSDLVFLWDVARADENRTLSLRERLRPNPLRYYGLFQTSLLAYVEKYSEGKGIAFEVRAESDGKLIASGSDSVRSSGDGPSVWILDRDVSHLPAGSYSVAFFDPDLPDTRAEGRFQVLWDALSWTRDQRGLLDEAYVLLGPMEYEAFAEMSRGEMEAFLRDLWAEHDPDPTTGRNELRETFTQRVAHANAFYGTSFRKGMLTDRGRAYIRYGPPDEIDKELNPQDRDLLAQILPGEVAEDQYDVVRKPIRRDPRDNRAYEIWIYQIRGDPLFPEQMNPGQRTGLKFIFVDELGYGDMRLIYSNLSGGF